ncbi:MAG: hypothetical protein KGL45_11100 [Gammaproteobacteria bacterium]|nr:hypothetical protein [Gammaproteobacteria bacterium]
MTRRPPTRSVDPQFWRGRRDEARAFSLAAREAMDLASPGTSASPIVSQIVLAVIAYSDSLTAKRAQVVNQQDHAGAVRLLRDVLRSRLPDAQEKAFRRILRVKDEAQYGARAMLLEEARKLLADLDSFIHFIEGLLLE